MSIQKKAAEFLAENSTVILTGAGMAGSIATAVLAGRAGYKFNQLLQEEREDLYTMVPMEDRDKISPKELQLLTKTKVKIAVREFGPPILLGIGTVLAIFYAHKMSAQKAAALAAAYGMTQGRFDEYRKKAEEKLGVKKAETVMAELAHDQVTLKPPGSTVIIGKGDVICFDALNGRYFRSSADKLQHAENLINRELHEHQYASMTDFYDAVGVEGTTMTDHLGWNQVTTGPIEVKITATMSDDQQPILSFDFNKAPVSDYKQMY